MQEFEEIRPYADSEVRPVLEKILLDGHFLNTLARYNYPTLTKHFGQLMQRLTSVVMGYKLRGINDVKGFQRAIEPFLSKLITKTTSKVTFSGLENLKTGTSYLFLSNHRDIVLDPAFINYELYFNGFDTPRLAIGDNLLGLPFVSDLMRLNKSFIVKRSVQGRREKLHAYHTLSAYIHHSIDTGHSVWIAQSEGRAKDGNDKTDTAIIKMMHMSKKSKTTTFSDSIRSLNIVPIAISFEYDPCDADKAAELYHKATHGHYEKQKDEDMRSIAKGIEGYKGHVHVAFGTPLTRGFDHASEVADAIDRQILTNYRLHPSNFLAWDIIKTEHPHIKVPALHTLFPDAELKRHQEKFQQRYHRINDAHKPWFIAMYANPVINHYNGQWQVNCC
ncbi:1-acyl-sn-glycerol-3-phosphate acyltransferase [Candidatus Sororendozoicomonas aggregata]|uniref:1-acyl-sn-glycerol-3-phosphate acyltransferase n=1 Tax=Candidatus Sororendozoicomonas aggregata TaxID=3073239 RepID=UPI002ED6AD4B